jgi:hypothetical protein
MDNFRYVAWEVLQGEGIYFPMMENKQGELFTTGPAIQQALDLTKQAFLNIYKRNQVEFDSLRSTFCLPKDFLRDNKELFGIKRVREDMTIWSADDMLTFAFHSKTEKSLEFRVSLRRFIKEHSRRHYVTREQYEQMMSDRDMYKQKFDKLSMVAMTEWMPAAKITGTSAGKALNAQKKLKSLLGDYGLLN